MQIVKIKRSQIRTVVKQAQVTRRQNGMFVPYEFIAYDYDENQFYSSAEASSNSWTNYPGVKVWDNGGEVTTCTKAEIVDYIFDNLTDTLAQAEDNEWGIGNDFDFEFEIIGN